MTKTRRKPQLLFASGALLTLGTLVCAQVAAEAETDGDKTKSAPVSASTVSAQEARTRARILHETMHGALQVMHRDFFREDEGLNIPSRSLEDVFRELTRLYRVQLHWIAVDSKAMNVDNEPKTEFEKQAAEALKSGKDEFESVTGDKFHFAGRIRLSATCLSCHASRRSSNRDRAAGLVIVIPLQEEGE